MNSITFKIRVFNKDFDNDNIILSIHCPLEVFYLSVKQSQLKDMPEELRKDYIITHSDFYESGTYFLEEEIYSNLDILFKSKDFKEFCYLSYEYTKKGFDTEFECNLIGRFTTFLPANLEADLEDEDVAYVRENPVLLHVDEAEELFTAAENFCCSDFDEENFDQGGDIDG